MLLHPQMKLNRVKLKREREYPDLFKREREREKEIDYDLFFFGKIRVY